MKESAFPPCSWLLYVKMVRVNECHGDSRPAAGAQLAEARELGLVSDRHDIH